MSVGKTEFLEEPSQVGGSTAFVLSQKAPLHNRKGDIIGVLGISFDITDRKKQEQELKEAKERAELALREKEIAEAASRQKSMDLQEVLNCLTESRYYLSGKYEAIYVTRREAQCLVGLPRGLTSKHIAKILKISYRTVEIHLGKVKEKLSCHTRAQLIEALIECRFLEKIQSF